MTSRTSGILVGRFANRIARAQFELDGKRHRLIANEGPNQLHGGKPGFGKRLWRVIDLQSTPRHRLVLGLRSPEGDEGYPGNLDVSAEFIVHDHELTLRFDARCDEATPLNLTWHPYFNLSGDTRTAGGRTTPEDGRLPIPAGGRLTAHSDR